MDIKKEIKEKVFDLMNGILYEYQTKVGISDGGTTQSCEWQDLEEETASKWDEMIRSVLSEQIRNNN